MAPPKRTRKSDPVGKAESEHIPQPAPAPTPAPAPAHSSQLPHEQQSSDSSAAGGQPEVKFEGYISFGISYGLVMKLFHFYLANHFLGTVLLCQTPGCLTMHTFVHWLWLLQGLYYGCTLLGRWLPGLEVFVLMWWTHPLQGALFVAAAFIPGSSTPNSLYYLWDGDIPFSGVGTFFGIYIPIVYFWLFLFFKRNQISLFHHDFTNLETPVELVCRLVYEIFSPFLVVLAWEVFFRAKTLGDFETDLPAYPGFFWILLVVLVPNILLTLLFSVASVSYKGFIVWHNYPRSAYVLFSEPKDKDVVKIASFT